MRFLIAFQYCSSVGYNCYFDSQGYLYKDQITYIDENLYYLNANGALEQNGWSALPMEWIMDI